MDDNQNEWGDEETLDTKKFRVSPLPHSLCCSHRRSRGPSGPLIAAPSSSVTNTHLGALQSFPAQPWCFSGSSLPAVALSLRSRRCCRTRMTRRITGSGHSSTWTPLTCAFPPWPRHLHRGKSMLTAWMSTSEGRVRTPCASAVAVSSRHTLPQPHGPPCPLLVRSHCYKLCTTGLLCV